MDSSIETKISNQSFGYIQQPAVDKKNVDDEISDDSILGKLPRDINNHVSDNLTMRDGFHLSMTCHFQRQRFLKMEERSRLVEVRKEIYRAVRLDIKWYPYYTFQTNQGETKWRESHLKDPLIRKLIYEQALDIPTAKTLNLEQLTRLSLLQQHLEKNEVTAVEVITLDPAKFQNVALLNIAVYQNLSYQQLMKLTPGCITIFRDLAITKLLEKKVVTLAEFVEFRNAVIHMAKYECLQSVYVDKKISLTELDRLSSQDLEIFNSNDIQNAVKRRVISVHQVIETPGMARLLIENKFIRDEIVFGVRTINDVLAFSPWQIQAMNNQSVYAALENCELTTDEVLGWNEDQVVVLHMDWIAQPLINKEVTVTEVMDRADLLKEIDEETNKGTYRQFPLFAKQFGYQGNSKIIKSDPDAIRFLLLSDYQWTAQAVQKKLLTIDKILNLAPERIRFLRMQPVQSAITKGDWTFNDICTLPLDELLNRIAEREIDKAIEPFMERKRNSEEENCLIQ